MGTRAIAFCAIHLFDPSLEVSETPEGIPSVIEFAIIDNGPHDLQLKQLPGDMWVPEGDMEDMHRAMQKTVINQVRNAVLAEQSGFHYCFFTEHHFQPEGNEYSPNPLLLGAAVAARTKHIRLGQMANILSWWHPIRLAEQGAMLDVLSGGRLEFGVGRGLQPRETEVFAPYYGSSTHNELKSLQFFEESIEVIMKAWSQPSFSHHGEFFSFPAPYVNHHHAQTIAYFSQPDVGRTLDEVLTIGDKTKNPISVFSHATTMREMQVYPRPLQTPYPQFWQPSVMSKRSLERAARLGMNVFVLGSSMEAVGNDVATYMAASEEMGWPDRHNGGEFKRGWDSKRKRGLGHMQPVHLVGNGIGDPERFRRGAGSVKRYISEYAPPGMEWTMLHEASKGASFVGSPQQVIDGFMQLKELGGYDDFLCGVNFNTVGITTEEVRDQIQCFSEEVMPELIRANGGAAPFTPADPEMAI